MHGRDAAKSLGLTGLMLGVTAIWGWTFTVVRDAVAVYAVLGFLAIRFGVATAALAQLAVRRATRRTLQTGAAIGAVLAVAYFFQTLGLKYTTPTNCGLVTGLFVLFVPLFDWLLYRIHVPRLLWAAVAASFVGMVLLVGDSPKQLRIGDALTFVAAAAYGLHISLLSRHAKGHDPVVLAATQMATVALLTGASWPVFEPVTLPSAGVWWAILVTALLASALAFYVQTLVQRRVSALRAGIIIATEPLFAAVFGYALAGDRLTGIQLAGGVLLIAAIAASHVLPVWQRARNRSGR